MGEGDKMTYYFDDTGNAISQTELISLIKSNLEYLEPTDPAYQEQTDLLNDITKEG